MFGKLRKNSPVKSILVFSLSNIGDVVLTCPVIDILLHDFPSARLTVMTGPKAQSLFTGHSRIELIVYDKHWPLRRKARWFWSLRRCSFDLLVDLRQSALGLFLPCRWRTPLARKRTGEHVRLKHLLRLQTVYPQAEFITRRMAIVPQKPASVPASGYAVIAAGAADSAKRWHPAGFAAAAQALMDRGQALVFVGGPEDQAIIDEVQKQAQRPLWSLAGKTDLRELAGVLLGARWVLTHDSGTMHLASYLNVPVAALWGPTDLERFRPWSDKSAVIFRGKNMATIQVEDVLNGIGEIL